MVYFCEIDGLEQLTKVHDEDAGLDIASSDSYVILPKESQVISTGLHVAVPANHVGLVWSRSGLSFKENIETGAGCIDRGYTGELKIKLYNLGDKLVKITKGQRIAQFLTIPINADRYTKVATLEEVIASATSNVVDGLTRGPSGFGSTGTN